jgi:hypothetical protein
MHQYVVFSKKGSKMRWRRIEVPNAFPAARPFVIPLEQVKDGLRVTSILMDITPK